MMFVCFLVFGVSRFGWFVSWVGLNSGFFFWIYICFTRAAYYFILFLLGGF